jgi:hypothetical protein
VRIRIHTGRRERQRKPLVNREEAMQDAFASKRPVWSAMSLAYVLAVGVYLHLRYAEMPTAAWLGALVGNIGYAVTVGGIAAGRFEVFGLRRRWTTVLAGVALAACGTVLANAG